MIEPVLVTPRPGTNRDNLLQALRHVHTQAQNARGAAGTVLDVYNRYLAWVQDAVRMLRQQVSAADLELLVLTRRYWALQALVVAVVDPVSNLVFTELDERVGDLGAAVNALDRQIARWSQPGRFVVADSSFYIHHPQKVEELDLRVPLGIREDRVHLLVPIVVVDELDTLKESKNPHVRWRARHTLQVLDAALPDPLARGQLRAEDFTGIGQGEIPRGELTAEILLDPPGHRRLALVDDEIIDRALAIQALAGRKTTLLTYDTGQSTRARAAGLDTVKLSQPAEDEPAG